MKETPKPFVLDYGAQRDILFKEMGTATVYRKKDVKTNVFYLVSVDKTWYEPVVGFQQYRRPSGVSKTHKKESRGFPEDPEYINRYRYARHLEKHTSIIQKCAKLLKQFRG